MLIYTLVTIATALPYVGYVFFILVWWPSRRDHRFSSIPWLVASGIIGFLLSILTPRIAAHYPDWKQNPTSDLVLAAVHFSFGLLVIYKLKLFTIVLMITANLAFLSPENLQRHTFLIRFSEAHNYQRTFGIILLILTLLPIFICFLQCFTGCPPHFTK